jgi:hypothetical protein
MQTLKRVSGHVVFKKITKLTASNLKQLSSKNSLMILGSYDHLRNNQILQLLQTKPAEIQHVPLNSTPKDENFSLSNLLDPARNVLKCSLVRRCLMS